jgi:hypothetical protein
LTSATRTAAATTCNLCDSCAGFESKKVAILFISLLKAYFFSQQQKRAIVCA